MTNDQIAEVCHEVNRGLCIALGDDSQLPWSEAPEWQRNSALDGVVFAKDQTRESHPSASHENWMKDKFADGWKYGLEKDTVAKTHPCLLRFEMLPREQQLKDHLFTTIVKVLS